MAESKPPFDALYREYVGRIYAYIKAQVKSQAEAEDVTSQVFIKALKAYGRFELRAESPSAWLFRIARNAVLDHHRRQRTKESLERRLAAVPEPFQDPAQVVQDRFRDRALATAVANLAERQREVVLLRHAGGLSFSEIGLLLDCSEDAAKMTHHRALRALRESLAEPVR